jgi:hypothetical protein
MTRPMRAQITITAAAKQTARKPRVPRPRAEERDHRRRHGAIPRMLASVSVPNTFQQRAGVRDTGGASTATESVGRSECQFRPE